MDLTGLFSLPPAGARLRHAGGLAAATLAYVVAGYLAGLAAPPTGFAGPVWLPAGVGLYFLLTRGLGFFPVVLVGATVLGLLYGAPLAGAVGVGLGATLGSGAAAAALRRLGFLPRLERVRDVLLLATIAGLGGTAISTLLGLASIQLVGLRAAPPALAWPAWWVGDAMGILVLTPLLLVWSRPSPRPTVWRLLEAALLAGLLVGLALFLFARELPRVYTVFPLVFWIAFRLGVRGVTAAVAVVLVLGLWYTTRGLGPLAVAAGHLASLQLFIAVLAASGLLFAAAVGERAHAGARIAESEELLRALFERTAVGVAMADPWGRYVHANRTFLDLVGYSLEELRGLTVQGITHPEDLAETREVFRQLHNDRRSIARLEKRYRTKQGHLRWARNTVSTIPDEEGGVRLVIAIVEDITESVLAREEVRWLEEANRELVERAPIPIFRSTHEGRVVIANPAFATMLGYSRVDEVTALTLGRDVYVRGEDREEAVRNHEAGGDTCQLEAEWQRRDGSRLWVEIRSRAVRDRDRNVRYFENTVVDITARRHAELLIQAFNRTTRLLGGEVSVDRLLETAIKAAASLVEAEGALAGVRTPEGMVTDRYWRADLWVRFPHQWSPGIGLPGYVLASGAPYLTNAAEHDPQVTPALREAFQVRAALIVPIPGADRTPIGFLEVHNTTAPGGFTAWHQQLLGAVAEATGLAMRSALSFGRLEEARALLEGEKDTLEQLARGVSLPAALARICRVLEQLAPPWRASILLCDAEGRRLHLGAAPSLPEEYNRAVDGIAIGPEVGSCGRAAALGCTVVTEDIGQDPRWADFRAVTEAHGLRSCWSRPIVGADGGMLGTFALYGGEPGRPDPTIEPLVVRMGHIAGLAIERWRDLTALERRTVELQESEERYRLLAQHLPNAAVFLFDDELRCVLAEGPAVRLTGLTKRDLEGRTLGQLVPAPLAAPAAARLQEALGGGEQEFELEFGGRVCRAHVLPLSGPRRLGSIGMLLVADISEERRHEAIRRRLFVRLMRAQEEERARIAREIHDEAGQALTAILVGLRVLRDTAGVERLEEQADRLHGIVGETLENLGRLARGLHPAVLGDHGLLAAVERHLRDYGSYGITTRLESAGFDGARLPPETETALYRIIQEALTNVARHSGAARATVHLRREDGWVEAVVADDGRGFDAEALLRVPDPTRGLGLHSIQERTTVLGGAVDVRSTPGTGTTVRVRLPVPA